MNIKKLYTLLKDNEEQFKHSENYYLVQFYEEVLEMVNDEIAKEAEKSAGRKPNVRNAVKQFLTKDDYREPLKKASVQVINGTTYYGYCDGFKLAWSPVDFGFGVNEDSKGLKWESIINIQYRGEKDIIAIDNKFKEDLAVFIKTHKKSDRAPYTIHGSNGYEIDVNPYYLKACIDFTDANEMVVDLGSHCAPIVMYGKEDRNALVLPIRR